MRGRPVAGAKPAAPEGSPRHAGSARPARPQSGGPPTPPPPWRDPWAWLSVAPALLLVFHSLGAPLGEPVADDFDFLRRALIERRHDLLDGGGSLAFWRPLAHQVYFALVGPLALASPGAVAGLQAALLGLGSLLLYRTWRIAWPGPIAAAAAGLPLLAESARMLVTWSSESVELGAYVFSALALHEASRRRMATSLAALLGALLSKEVGVVTALMLPWLPRSGPSDTRSRLRWALASLLLVLLWGAAYVAVRRHTGMELPHGMEHNPAFRSVSVPAMLSWSVWNSARAAMSLALMPGRWDVAAGVAAAVVVALIVLSIVRDPRARARAARALPWALWGVSWFLASCATLVAVYPLWAPGRTLFGAIGLGVALAGLAGAVHPALLGLLVAVKLAAFAVSPAPPRMISILPEDRGAWADFSKISRLQMLMRQTREALKQRYPELPHGARVSQLDIPIAAEYAFGGSKALQVWYRDSTLEWVRYEQFRQRPDIGLTTLVQYQDRGPRQVVLVEAAAMTGVLRAYELLGAGDARAALREANRADSLQVDRHARSFVGSIAGLRAMCLAATGESLAAEREARLALDLWPASAPARLALAQVWIDRGDTARAEASLGEVLALYPQHEGARLWLDQLRTARRASPRIR